MVIPHLLIVSLLVVLRLVESIKCIIEVRLSHEGLGKGDHDADLDQLGLCDLRRKFFYLVQGEGEVLDGLLDALEAEVGLSEMVVR